MGKGTCLFGSHEPSPVEQYEKNNQLIKAVSKNDLEAVKKYIRKKYHTYLGGRTGVDALYEAIICDHPDMIDLLLQNNVPVDGLVESNNSKDSQTPLLLACQLGKQAVVEKLLSYKANIKAMDKRNNETVLHKAAQAGNLDLVNFLLQKNIDINPVNRSGETPLFKAVDSGWAHISNALIDRKADITIRDAHQNSLLHRASLKGYLDIAQLLLKMNAAVNAVNDEGNTPLHEAAKNGNLNLTRALWTHGALASATNQDGKTPLDFVPKEASRATKLFLEIVLKQALKQEIKQLSMNPHEANQKPLQIV
ncbi:ankyrin repeat domain-containing protein [Legionella sp. W05-934-2]|uniref:ankyrin repeat domain-containing protein n=1 Tax=Legionella sp. W05-934-2 TaxID=1198649 RepID=UPI0034617EA3